MKGVNPKECREGISYADVKKILQANIKTVTRSFVAVGYYLKLIRDTEGFKEDGYNTIWEFAEAEYGLLRTTASRWMAINDRFSEGGNSPALADQYKDFGKSQLQEMLYLTDEQTTDVTPDMTVKEIREIRKLGAAEEIPEEPVSALGYPRRVYAEDSLIGVPGCGNQDCFACHRDGCGIRGEECYCVEAPLGNPFPCTLLSQAGVLRQEIGSSCQFVNSDLARARAGDGQPVPCCKRCNNPCNYECCRSGAKMKTEKQDADTVVESQEECVQTCATSHTTEEEQLPGQVSIEDYQRAASETDPIKDEAWFVREYFTRYGDHHLPELMRICREERLMSDKVKAVKNLISPHGGYGGGSCEFGYDFGSISQGVSFDADNWTAEIQMTYRVFIIEMLKMYNPWDTQWLPSESEKAEDVPAEEPEAVSGEVEGAAYEEENETVADGPHFTVLFLRDILWDKEHELEQMEACNALPDGKLPERMMQEHRAVVAGLRLLLELTEMEEEAEDDEED